MNNKTDLQRFLFDCFNIVTEVNFPETSIVQDIMQDDFTVLYMPKLSDEEILEKFRSYKRPIDCFFGVIDTGARYAEGMFRSTSRNGYVFCLAATAKEMCIDSELKMIRLVDSLLDTTTSSPLLGEAIIANLYDRWSKNSMYPEKRIITATMAKKLPVMIGVNEDHLDQVTYIDRYCTNLVTVPVYRLGATP